VLAACLLQWHSTLAVVSPPNNGTSATPRLLARSLCSRRRELQSLLLGPVVLRGTELVVGDSDWNDVLLLGAKKSRVAWSREDSMVAVR
jgi:hypothetical protein